MSKTARILLVDDDPSILLVYSEILRLEGYEVANATTGAEGLRIVRDTRPHLVLLDVVLPDGSGMEVCRQIKNDAALPDTFVALFSGEATSGAHKMHGAETGADDYIVKPVGREELLARVHTMLRLREATVALRASEQHYRRLVELLPDAVCSLDSEGRLLAINPQGLNLLGYRAEQVLTKTIFDLTPPTEHSRIRGDLELARAAGILRNVEYTLVRKGGEHLPVELSLSISRDEQTQAEELVGVIRDISQRKRAQEALEESRRLSRAILDNIPDPAWLKDAEGRYLACNEALARLLGRRPEEIIGRSDFELYLPDADRLAAQDEQVRQERKLVKFEAQRTDAAGHVRWLETSQSPLLGEGGVITGTVGIARDTTERKWAEEELRSLPRRIIEAQEAERLRVSRELHDGVNQLIASAQMRLRRVEAGVPEFRPAAREILSRCHDLLVEALEENRRIAHNLRPGELDELGLTTACRQLCKQLHIRTNVAVRCHIARLGHSLSPVTELNLFRIVQEAFNNVEKYAHAKTLRLSISLKGDVITLVIQDDGCGFDPNRAKSNKGSTGGAGLTNIRERVAALGGTCEIKSAPNQGTTITVRVPGRPAELRK